MYYNADLLDIPEGPGTSLGFIDDVVYGAQGQTSVENARKLKLILKEVEKWRKKHGAQFERSKYILVYYTHNSRQAIKASITIDGARIEPSDEARYLGVIFDQKLNFKSHLQYVVKKGTSATLALSGIAKSNWGAQYKYARRLFNSVIAARTDYAVSIWHQPNSEGKAASTKQIQRLTTIQRLAMKAITGCYKTTPTAAMEKEADLQPTWIWLQTKVLQAISRMQSLSGKHPLREWFKNALRTRTANVKHRSNLENILQQFPHITVGNIETIEPFIRPPWWTLKAEIKIEPTKDNASILHNKSQECATTTMMIYTDGSGINNNIGAAAYNATTNTTTHQYLGSETQHNVYAAELKAMHLGVKMLENNDEYLRCHMYMDSEVAIKVTVGIVPFRLLSKISEWTDEFFWRAFWTNDIKSSIQRFEDKTR